jgi:hypothetical protein
MCVSRQSHTERKKEGDRERFTMYTRRCMHSLTVTHTHRLMPSLTNTHTHTHSRTHTNTHTHTHTHSHSRTHTSSRIVKVNPISVGLARSLTLCARVCTHLTACGCARVLQQRCGARPGAVRARSSLRAPERRAGDARAARHQRARHRPRRGPLRPFHLSVRAASTTPPHPPDTHTHTHTHTHACAAHPVRVARLGLAYYLWGPQRKRKLA